jgi:integrase
VVVSMGRRSFGRLRELSSGRFQASYVDPRSSKRVNAPVTFRTKKAANNWLVDIQAAMNRGELPDLMAGRRPFREWAQHWLDTRQVRNSTRRSYTGILKNHVNPVFGDQAINTIDRRTVTRFLADISETMAPGNVVNVRRVLSMVLNEAARSGAISRNPTDGVRVKRPRRQEMVFLSRDQVAALAEKVTHPKIPCGKGFRYPKYPEYGFLVRFASETGLRAGEIAALRIGRVDLVSRRIHVVESAAQVPRREAEGGIIYQETKTYEARSVPLTRSLAAELTEHLKSRPQDPKAFVFVSPGGGALHYDNFYNRHFKPAVIAMVDKDDKRLIPERTRFHDLRHTYATLLVAAGANPLAVKQRMGHSSITVTMDRYAHLFPHLEEDVTDRMDEAYRQVHRSGKWHGCGTEPGNSAPEEGEPDAG